MKRILLGTTLALALTLAIGVGVRARRVPPMVGGAARSNAHRAASPASTAASSQVAIDREPAAGSSVPNEVLACLDTTVPAEERQRALLAAMAPWGARDVVAAIAWALEQEEPWSSLAIEGALSGAAATRPDFAVEVGRQLLAADPAVGAAQASALIRKLGDAGRFDLATQLAVAAPSPIAQDLAADMFALWARSTPETALSAVAALSDDRLRHYALLGVIDAWASTDPAGLAQRAWSSFTGEDRGFALRQAIAQWAAKDLGGLTQWVGALPPGTDRDDGATVVAVGLAKYDPRAAFAWTTSISDPDGRFRSLQRVAAEVDRNVARACVSQLAGIAPAERNALLRQIDCTP